MSLIRPSWLPLPSIWAAGHIEVHDFTRAVVHDKEREDGAKERVVELKEVACPNLAGMVFEEGAPGLPSFARWPCAPDVLLNGSLADANAQLQQLAADPLRAPEHVVFGHGLNECDDLRRETLRLTMGPGLSSPDDLEQIPMPVQQGLGTNHAQGVSPSTVQSGEREKHQAVVAVQSRPPDAATQYDDLLFGARRSRPGAPIAYA